MRKRQLALVIVLVLAGLLLALQKTGNLPSIMRLVLPSAQQALVVSLDVSPIDQFIPSVLDVPPEQMPQALEAAYRLRPDRRFLEAVGEIHLFLTGQSKTNTVSKFQDKHWEIQYRKITVGSLPEYPDYSDFLSMLTAWGQRLAGEFPIDFTESANFSEMDEIQSLLNQFTSPYAAAAVKQSNVLWESGVRHPKILESAARSLILLSFQGLNRLETGDIVPAKALAMLALAKTFSAGSLIREEALLAETLDYSGYAIKLVESLPPQDPIRLYIKQEDEDLDLLAHHETANMESRYLWLMRLSQNQKIEEWAGWLAEGFEEESLHLLPLLRTGLEMNSFYSNGNFPKQIQQLILFDIAREANLDFKEKLTTKLIQNLILKNKLSQVLGTILGMDTDLSTLISRFETDLELLNDKYSGPFLDSETYKTWYRSNFYSSVFIESLFYLDSLSSAEAARAHSDLLGKAAGNLFLNVKRFGRSTWHLITTNQPTSEKLGKTIDLGFQLITGEGTEAQNFKRWYDHLIDAKFGEADLQALVSDITELPVLGSPAWVRSLEEAKPHFPYGDPGNMICIKRLAYLLDTRPQHRFKLASLVKSKLYDLRLAYDLYHSALVTNPERSQTIRAWFASLNGDVKLLKKLVHSEKQETYIRVLSLEYLHDKKNVKSSFFHKEYNRLIRQDPDDWYLRKKYVDYLQGKKEYSKAREVIAGWLNRKVVVTGLQKPRALTLISEMYYLEGRYEEAWPTTAEALESGTGDSMDMAARLLEKMGKPEEARKFFLASYKRYPDSTITLANWVGFLWRQGHYDEAAQVLQKYPFPLATRNWRFTLAKKFAEAFAHQPAQKGQQAYQALHILQVSPVILGQMTFEVTKAGNPELAYKIQAGLKQSGYAQMDLNLQAYKFLKQWKGDEAATAWAEKNLARYIHGPGSMVIYRDRQFPLLWALIKSPDEYGWLLRAAASLVYEGVTEKNQKRMLAYYSLPNIESEYYGTVGKYLLGMASEEDVLKKMDTPKKRCEFAYFLGLKAQQEGRYKDATNWYRISMETGLRINGEYVFSQDALRRLSEKSKTLSRMAAEHRT